MNDESLMPYGKFKGKKLEDVPAWYLLSILSEHNLDRYEGLEDYILDNEDSLILEKQNSD